MALRAFRGYVVTERSRSNGIGIDGQEWLYEHSVCTRLLNVVKVMVFGIVCKTFLSILFDSESYFFINYFYKDFFNHII